MRMILLSLCASGLVWAGPELLRVAYDADPASLDPHEQLSGGTLQMSHLCFDPLVRWTRGLELEPRLAESWERVDGTRTRFTLREGVRFHSGRTLSSEDVAWTFARLRRSPDFKGLFAPFKGVEIVDGRRFDLVTEKPYPLVLNLATYIFPMDREFYAGKDGKGRPKDAIVKHGSSFASRNLSGTGPFRIGHREQGVRVDFTRFADHWDRDQPGNVRTVRLTPVKEDATRVAALLAGEVDFIAPVPPADLDRLRKDPRVRVETMPGTRIVLLQLNQKRQPAFADPRVRRAVDLAINNEGIARVLMNGFATAAGQLSPAGYAGHDPARTPRHDIEAARALMAEAGHADGLTVTMAAPNNRYVNDARIAVAVVNMLKRVNVTVHLRTMPKAQYWPEFDRQGADIMMIGWHSDTEDSANFIEFLAMTRDPDKGYGQYNNANYSNPEVDRLVLASQTETDADKRRAMLRRAEGILIDEAAFVPLHWQNLAWASRRSIDFRPVVNVMNFPYLGDLVVEQGK